MRIQKLGQIQVQGLLSIGFPGSIHTEKEKKLRPTIAAGWPDVESSISKSWFSPFQYCKMRGGPAK